MTEASCKAKKCFGKWVVSAVPVFIFLLVIDYVMHHICLMSDYQATANLWRPMDQMPETMPWMIVYQAVLALVMTALYCKCKVAAQSCEIAAPVCPRKQGVCFGVIMGVLLGAMHASAWVWLPIPVDLAVKWFVVGLVEGIGSGVILSLGLFCRSKCTAGKSE